MAEQNLEVIISADVSELQRALSRMESDTSRVTDTVSNDVDKAEESIKRSTDSIARHFENLSNAINGSLNLTQLETTVDNAMDNVEDDVDEAERSVKRSNKNIAESFEDLGRRINESLRNIGGLMKGALISSFPAFIPMVAVASAGVMALASSFASAGAGAVGFGAVAVTVLGDVFEASEELGKAQDELDKATTQEDRTKALEKQAEALAGLSEEQKRAVTALQEFKSFWDDLASSFETPVVDIFTQSLSVFQSVISQLQPAIEGSMRGVQTLVDALSVGIESDDMKEFFDFLNTNAQSSIEAFGLTAGNVFRGFANLMVAFAPLSKIVEQGLVGMSEAFAEWTSTLGESEEFKQFLDYVSANAPIVIGFIGDLVSILGNLLVFLAPLGSLILNVFGNMGSLLSGVMEEISGAMSSGNFDGLVSTIQSLAPQLVSSILDLVDSILSTINSLLPVLVTIGGEILVALLDGLLQNAPMIMTQIMTIITTIINSLTTIIGTYLPAILQMGLGILTAIVNGIIQNLPMIITAITTLVTTLIQFLIEALPMIMEAGILLLEGIITGIMENLPILAEAIVTILNTLATFVTENLPMIMEVGISLLTSMIEGLLSALPQMTNTILDLILMIATVILQNLPTILQAGLKITLAVIRGIIDMLPELITCIIELVFEIQQSIMDNLPAILEAGVEILLSVIEGILSMESELDSAVLDIIDAVFEGFAGVDWKSIGKDILSGVAKGITRNAETVLSAIGGIANSALEKARKVLRSGSPSKVFEERVGKTIPQGIASGIRKESDTALNAVEDMENQLTRNRLGDTVNKIPNFTTTNNNSNLENIFNISSLVVREEADLLKLAEELNRVMKRQEIILNRAGGRAYGY